MRTNMGFGVALAVASLTAAGTAYAQTGAAGAAGGQGTPVGVGRTNTSSSSSLLTAPNNLEQQANEAATTPPVPGQVTPAPAAGNQNRNPLSGYQAPGNTTNGVAPAGGANANPANMAPGTVNNNAGYAPGAGSNSGGAPRPRTPA